MSSDLFGTPDVLLRFADSELTVLRRPIEGDGGHQRLLESLVKRMGRTGDLVASDRELVKVRTYAEYNDGSGGYQGRFKILLSVARRSGWVEP